MTDTPVISQEPKISAGNMKMGNIPSFSLPPIISCPNSAHCHTKCYALKAFRQYPKVREAYHINLEYAEKDIPGLKAKLLERLKKIKSKYFRIHVSGDFINQEYLDMWKEIAKENENKQFLAFTKAFSLDYADTPDNLTIIFSVMDTMPTQTAEKLKNKFNVPIAYAGYEIPKNREEGEYFECPGSCSTCKTCWDADETYNVFFHYH